MSLTMKRYIIAVLSFLLLAALLLVAFQESRQFRVEAGLEPVITAANEGCVECHSQDNPALVMDWEASRHSEFGVGCIDCHAAEEDDIDAWKHEGAYVSALVTPIDCGKCHAQQLEEFAGSHHAKAGEILASLDNVLAEKVAGMPGNIADAVNGCWQCHGSLIRFEA